MNILLIDDDEDCLDSLVNALESAGHWCDKFTFPGEAMEAYGQNQYDVVITDLNMSGMNGIQVLKRIRYLNPEAKVIINAGHGDLSTAIAAVNNGAYAFFVKPADLLELIETLEGIELEITEQMLILSMPGWLWI
ncbi:MAG: C4-dicarboxylate transport transcriptional regulatory protein DctD [Pelotomaculum sp. PtaB.Bin013]|uniref:Stage 0 sporulation protein A homolog n=1 Tax=Pelotomaculum isophthalicicum JI TaxID=947010 RepID=A0A9X4H091_9FIRM|nr:response regulator [Pelotomaculum isophthalicicum]MDF9407035.1 response regulator [Pelotomaculum isophthalicicum JI]OPX89151.1 MAG: C4-dicarboxylate transport transcriptional regulatory protein DctD [Pelotomaculum sp. PtaB.Bin013]